jgi:hypothetical protein
MNCKAYRSFYEEPDADAALSAGAREHLAGCEACARLLRERAALRRLLGGLERVEAPADFDFRLRARLRAAGAATGPGLMARLLSPAAASALAACAVLAVTAGVYFKRPAAVTQTEHTTGAAQKVDAPAPPEKLAGENVREVASADGPEMRKAVEASDEAREQLSPRAKTGTGSQKVVKTEKGRADSAVRMAPVLSRRDGEVTFVNPPVAVPLPAARQPLRVMLRDESGASRALSMRAVSFGSQEFISRLGGPQRTSNTSKEGVW